MMGGNMGDLMKQAQKMQQQLQEQQEELAKAEVEGQAGAGMVTVTMNGRHDVRKVKIEPSLLTEDIEILEDLVAAAVNDAVKRIEEKNKNSMAGMMSGMGMPPNFKMPF